MQTLQQLRNGELKGATALKLSAQLSEFPSEIFELAETLEFLDLSGNQLSELPEEFGRLQQLKIFFCSDNNFKHLPEELSQCPLLDIVGFKANQIASVSPKSIHPNLRWLILTNNKINKLPAEIGQCSRMQKLMLAGNRLTVLPVELSNCNNLGLLRISANQLTEFPEWLLEMPKLSWLAFSGNPFVKSPEITPLDLINWEDMELNHVLGQGASGIIYQAKRSTGGVPDELAVKIFKGEVTSDGLPQDEMNTCITAGLHPGLVKLIGQISAHPKGKKGLVMELISERFYNLGGPPSFSSCTRDVFPETFKLEPGHVLKIAATIASVAAQLHSKKIMHGDLYAHNILIDEKGNTLFGDFGAATFYENPMLEKIEVRAFGYLIEDLMSVSENNQALAEIMLACQSANLKDRPSFKDLVLKIVAL